MGNEALENAKKAIVSSFLDVGICSLEDNPQKIKELTRKLVDTHIESYALSWTKQPDLVGEVKVEKPLPQTSPRSIIAEVVEDKPDLDTIYRVKKYAEIMTPDYVLIVSKKPLKKSVREFIQDNPRITKYLVEGTKGFAGSKEITFALLHDDGGLSVDSAINVHNPFDAKRMWS